MYGAACESVYSACVLWECSAYSSGRLTFLVKLQELHKEINIQTLIRLP